MSTSRPTAALAPIPWLFVIARNSSFTYKGHAVDVKQVGREIGVRYVLEGSVRKAAGRVRITCQLIEAQTGSHLWADRFDGDLADVSELQDRIGASVAGAIEPTLRTAEVERARRKRPESLDAYDLYLRALPELRAVTADSSARALALLCRAIEIEPGYAAALAAMARCCGLRRANIWASDEAAESAEGLRLARAAVAADREDSTVLANAGVALGFLARDTDAAVPLLDKAIALNPNSAVGWGYSGIVRMWSGDHDTAIEHCARAMRLSPLDPETGIFLRVTGIAHLLERRLEEALLWLHRADREHLGHPALLVPLTVAYAQLGRLEEARAALRGVLEHRPQITIARWARRALFKQRADREFIIEGLRKAGLPEE